MFAILAPRKPGFGMYFVYFAESAQNPT